MISLPKAPANWISGRQYSIFVATACEIPLQERFRQEDLQLAACSFHTTSAVLYFSTMKTCNGTLLASGQLVTSQVQCTCLRKNNTTQTLLTTHEVQTANKTLIQIQHAKCRIHSANVSTGNAVTMSYGPSFHQKSSTSRHHYLFDYRTRNSTFDSENSSILRDCAVTTFQGLSIQVVWDMKPCRLGNIYPTQTLLGLIIPPRLMLPAPYLSTNLHYVILRRPLFSSAPLWELQISN